MGKTTLYRAFLPPTIQREFLQGEGLHWPQSSLFAEQLHVFPAQTFLQPGTELFGLIRPFQHSHTDSAYTTGFLHSLEQIVCFVQNQSQENHIEGVITKGKVFRNGLQKISLWHVLVRTMQHPGVRIDPGYRQSAPGEFLGENTAARTDIESGSGMDTVQYQVNDSTYFQSFETFRGAQARNLIKTMAVNTGFVHLILVAFAPQSA
jgi:hypothetical protein